MILDRGCFERGCMAYDWRDGDGVNISQERVDETAKCKHEYVLDCPRCGHCCPERAWVGLTEADIYELMEYEDEFEFARSIEAKLKEKNT
jgi:hypothetical protein